MYFSTSTTGLGGKIKSFPEDFIVEEITEEKRILSANYGIIQRIIDSLPRKRKDYLHFTLVKRNWDTISALRELTRRLHISLKRIGYAGNKDKFAITAQRCSIWKMDVSEVRRIKLKDIIIKDFDYSDKKIEIGMLYGNRFTVTIREIPHDKNEIAAILHEFMKSSEHGILNYFGIQRFGDKRSVNHLVGKEILKHNFKEAIRIFLCETDGVEYGKEAREYLARNWGNFKEVLKIFPTHLKPERTIIAHLSKYPNDYVGALRKLPKFLRLIFVNSYQSYLFNLTLDKLWENGMRKNVKVPMVGYNLKLGEDEISCIIKEIMRREGIGLEDFKVKSMPEMSVSGSERDYLFFPENFEILKISDNLVKVRFILKKGCYATTLLRELMKSEDGK